MKRIIPTLAQCQRIKRLPPSRRVRVLHLIYALQCGYIKRKSVEAPCP